MEWNGRGWRLKDRRQGGIETGGGGRGRVVTGDKNYVCRDRIFLSG